MGNERQIIMLVDDNMASLTMGKNILKDKYNVFPIPSGEKLFEVLQKVTPDLILLDIAMPDMDGYEVIKKLKADRKTQDIPVVFLTSRDDPGNELEGLSLGAIDYVSKPFSPALLAQRIDNHLLLSSQKKELKKYNDNLKEMVLEQTQQIEDLQNAVMSTVAEVVEFRDDIIGGHIERVQSYLKFMLDQIIEEEKYPKEMAEWDLDFLIPSAQLHDVGKILVSEKILSKPGKLTPEEFEEIKKHTSYGIKVIDRISGITREHAFLDHAKIIAGAHHERWDGKGYPNGLAGENIPLQGRLMAIADVYDALIAVRPYKQPVSTAEAAKIITEGKGTQFDPVLVDIFQTVASKFAKIAERESPLI
ncbi:HD domain-containing phosphohydrolase [Leadbettera azotonutricia]|uniref:Response regulator n=1 Tax=Leadbettera azotonutricia (strain ATCC BAA-888 / DSM 13862 / ZAS-9) TaxID=545695 RepID=F5YAH3_LEAAZ|nr:HD domain-containing phosphohydrolase [Leadbettera azotonutricia]AEF80297.1 response regulator [Leadbettera azotonutricia ZAS-9]